MEFLDQYDSEDESENESESSLLSANSEEVREREAFHRGDANFPLIVDTIWGKPLVIYQDRAFTINKRRHNKTDPAGVDTIYIVSYLLLMHEKYLQSRSMLRYN